ncbi:MAG: hypothetical protein DWQ31_12445 [Planctomycetota bacterium]|nr:MAG: hypothetical protein DWQ31_12445 [Planctomycetota bacterium]
MSFKRMAAAGGGRWDLGEFVLPSAAVQQSATPDDDLLTFFESTDYDTPQGSPRRAVRWALRWFAARSRRSSLRYINNNLSIARPGAGLSKLRQFDVQRVSRPPGLRRVPRCV